ncbi:MAG: diguanylate cyclase [Syntrophomonadaceae bacterium]|nr:diguanylate cyclase [Syntrophomonadaceae bacterium]MDD4562370.1 diguanylate cyclase [Syntrophomonadaceae bacterium]
MKVLIADDDALSRKILEDCLSEWGYDILMAHNGNEAWDILEKIDRPNMAVLDWMMPGMDGVEICRKLRQLKLPNYVYVILLTARSKREDVISGLESGADDYIIKPFNREELKSRLKIGQRIIELEHRILRLASTDYLTGLLNRRAFLERLERELNRCQREASPMGIIIMDIDHFKRVNDNFGHQVGDLVLQELSHTLVELCRVYDFTGRYGGEEFIVCLPGADKWNTYQIAERMRSTIESKKTFLLDKKSNVSVTASFGIVSMEPGQIKSADRLINEADEALYRAKEQGRNRVVMYVTD